MDEKIKAEISFRLATKDDLKINKTTLRWGQAYAVINADGVTISGMHIITVDTDPMELKVFLDQNRLLVPVSCLDSDIRIIKSK